MLSRSLVPAIAVSCLAMGCTIVPGVEPAEGHVTKSLFVVPDSLSDLSDEHFFDQPWPSDLRLENGSPRLTGFPNPRGIPLITQYVEAMNGALDGFSPAAAGFLRFSGPIDPGSLPASPSAALDPSSSVQLVDVDLASPEHGMRKLVSLSWHPKAGVYWAPNTLAFMPTFGFPLRSHTRYALVVTREIRAEDETRIEPGDDLREALGDAPAGAKKAAADALAPAIRELAALGIARDDIAHLAVLTTADPTAELFAVADDVHASVPPPVADPAAWHVKQAKPEFDEYVGVYGPSPNYQTGAIPYLKYGDGGAFTFDGKKPIVVDLFDLRFSLTIPKADACPMPAEGYPVVMYAHGTGGDYRTYVYDGTGTALAQQCVASMGVDQIFHGTRPGAPPEGNIGTIELLSFNFENVVAARTNARQSAIDEVQRARLFTESHVVVPASVSLTGTDIVLDGRRLMFFGHSQGGLNGPLFLAADDAARGGVLAGSAAEISITLLEKTEPTPSVAGLVKMVFLGLKAGEDAEVDAFHPAISLAQAIVDVVDPIHYARHVIMEPRPGYSPKSLYMIEGVNAEGTGDSYSPPHGIEAHAIALGLPLQLPDQHAIVESSYGGPVAVDIPTAGLTGNLAGGAASGVLGQWAIPAGKDGHFVVFEVPGARAQAAEFCRNLAANPKGLVPAP